KQVAHVDIVTQVDAPPVEARRQRLARGEIVARAGEPADITSEMPPQLRPDSRAGGSGKLAFRRQRAEQLASRFATGDRSLAGRRHPLPPTQAVQQALDHRPLLAPPPVSPPHMAR